MKTKGFSSNFLFAAFLFVYCSSLLNAQYHLQLLSNPANTNYDNIVSQTEAYYASRDKGPGSGYKQFQRWKEEKKNKLDANRNLISYDQLIYNNLNFSQPGNQTLSEQWQCFGPDGSGGSLTNMFGVGRINRIVVDPSDANIIYVGTPAGGLWRTIDGGTTWTALLNGLNNTGVTGIAIDPSSPVGNRTIYILTGDGVSLNTYSTGVFVSANNGSTFSKMTGFPTINQATTGYAGDKIMVHPTNSSILFVAMYGGLYQSANKGLTWTKVITGTRICDIEFMPGTPATVYASSTDGRVFRSTDSGATFPQILNGLPTLTGFSGNVFLGVTPINAQVVYVFYANSPASNQFTGLYKSTNAGTTFSLMSNSPNVLGMNLAGNDGIALPLYNGAFAVSPLNANIVYAVSFNAWSSVDGGATWQPKSNKGASRTDASFMHTDFHDVIFNGSTVFCANDGGIYKSTDNGTTWVDISAGLKISQIYAQGIHPTIGNKILFGSQDNGTYYWESNTYRTLPITGDGQKCFFDNSVNPSRIYYSTQGQTLIKSTNNGYNVTNVSAAGVSGLWSFPFFNDPSSPSTIFLGSKDLYRSTNQGTSYTNISNGSLGSTNYISEVKIAPSNSNIFYATKDGNLYRSATAGASWTIVVINGTTFPGIGLGTFTISETDPNKIWITGMQLTGGINRVFFSSNGGTTWVNRTFTGLPSSPTEISRIVHQRNSPKDRVYVGTINGVFYLDNDGCKWISYNSNNSLPLCEIRDIGIDYTANKLIVSTYGRGAWWADVPPNSPTPIPSVYITASNYFSCSGEPITLTGNGADTYSWSTGSTQSAITVTPTVSTTYTVTGTKSSSGCTATATYFSAINPVYNGGTLNITTNTIWPSSGGIFLSTNLSIEPNVTLTVKTTVNIPYGAKLIVKPGGKLIIDGGVIQSSCTNPWKGVEVWGSSAQRQLSTLQGTVSIINSGKILNAEIGITTCKKDASGNIDWTTTGGIVQCTDAVFRNNKRAVEFLSYQNKNALGNPVNNVSYFTNCTFETISTLPGNALPYAFITMYDVSGINVNWCNFRNTALANYTSSQRGAGIIGYDAGFSAGGACLDNPPNCTTCPCSNQAYCRFDGLTEGINATFSVSSLRRIYVIESKFDNVQRGIQCVGSAYSSITASTFSNIPIAQSAALGSETYGVYMNGATNFTISNNNAFTGAGTQSSTSNNYGVILSNSLNTASDVSFNTYGNLYAGTQTQNNNGSGSTGLKISCNAYNTGFRYAWAINPQSPTGSIANQGEGCLSSLKQAGNTWNYTSTAAENQIKSTINFQYYAANGPGMVPTYVSPVVGNNPCGASSNLNSCVIDNGPFFLKPLTSGGSTSNAKLASGSASVNLAADTSEGARLFEQNTLIRRLLAADSADFALALLEADNNPAAKRVVLGEYLSRKNMLKAKAALKQLPFATAEDQDFSDHYKLISGILGSGKTIYQMDATQENGFSKLANAATVVSYNAKAALMCAKNKKYNFIIERFAEKSEAALKKAQSANTGSADSNEALLDDNIPNPFNENSVINSFVPANVISAYLIVYDYLGKLAGKYKLQSGYNVTEVSGNGLSGVYFYSLEIDGNKVATKKMVVVH